MPGDVALVVRLAYTAEPTRSLAPCVTTSVLLPITSTVNPKTVPMEDTRWQCGPVHRQTPERSGIDVPLALRGSGPSPVPVIVQDHHASGERVGSGVGELVGAGVCELVGAGVGQLVGAGAAKLVGAEAGELVVVGVRKLASAGVGELVGARVGEKVGTGVSELVGAGVGGLVGAGVGKLVGAGVGELVGAGVGELVRAGVGELYGSESLHGVAVGVGAEASAEAGDEDGVGTCHQPMLLTLMSLRPVHGKRIQGFQHKVSTCRWIYPGWEGLINARRL